MPPAARRIAAAAVALALAALPVPTAAAKPVGLVREIPVGGHIVDIAAGPEGNLWFTQNHPNGPGEAARIAVSRITPRARLTRFTAGLSSHKTEPSMIVAGADGNLWFTWEPRGAGGGGVGRVTPGGKITLFPEPPGQHGSPFEIAATPDGSIWFTHAAFFAPTGQTIGRANPLGEITEYSAGLTQESNITNPVAGPEGNLWFGDESNLPAVGRATPGGEIALFGGLPFHEFTIFEGPTPGVEGNLWFSANEPTPLVERVTPAGVVERFGSGLDPRTANVGPFAVSADGDAWFRIWKDAPPGRRDDESDLTAIGRIDPSGRITEFSDCLRPMQGYEGPNNLVRGPEGNIWFTTWSSGDPASSSPSSTPSIGRITPRGQITEFRLGLDRDSSLDDLVFAGGKLWSFDRSTESIVVFTPTSAPANTFLFYSAPRHGNGVRVYVPGPGRLRTSGPGLRTSAVPARRCGTASVPVVAMGPLRRRLRRHGTVRVRVRVTFTPRGGSPLTRPKYVVLR